MNWPIQVLTKFLVLIISYTLVCSPLQAVECPPQDKPQNGIEYTCNTKRGVWERKQSFSEEVGDFSADGKTEVDCSQAENKDKCYMQNSIQGAKYEKCYEKYPGNETQIHTCMQNNEFGEMTNQADESDEKKKEWAELAQYTSLITVLTMALKQGKDRCPAVWSMRLMVAAAAASALGEISGFISYYLEAKKIKEEFEENKVTDKSGQQARSFQYLKRQQKNIQDTAKIRKTAQATAAALYASAALMAIIEIWPQKKGTCKPGTKGTKVKNNYTNALILIAAGLVPIGLKVWMKDIQRKEFNIENPELDRKQNLNTSQIDMEKLFNYIFPSAHAKMSQTWKDVGKELIKLAGAREVAMTLKALSAEGRVLENAMTSPITRASVATLAAGASKYLHSYHKKVEEEAKERVRLLDKVSEKVDIDSKLECDEQEKKDPSNIRCYCYYKDPDTDEWVRNTNNYYSATCRKSWGLTQNDIAEETDYKNETDTFDPKGCMSANGTYDPSCECRKASSSKKKNNECMKIPTNINSKFKLGQINWAGNMAKTVNDLLEGKGSFNDVDTKAMLDNYARAKRYYNKLIDKTNKMRKKNKKQPINLATLNEGFRKNVLNDLPSSLSTSNGYNNVANAPGTSTEDAFLKDIETEKVSQKAEDFSNVKYDDNSIAKDSPKEEEDEFEFDFGESSSSGGAVVIEDVMDKKYNFRDNDIRKDKSDSLFKIISNRYFVSGLKRLFKEKKRQHSF